MATRTDGSFVLDTSVVAAWFLPDDRQHPRAAAVRRDLRDHPDVYVVPVILFPELIHVLARRWTKAESVRSAVRSVLQFGMRSLPLTDVALMRAADWACRGLGGYDASFVALSEDIGARWLTADARAARIAGKRALTLDRWAKG